MQPETLGARLRRLREARGLSQRNLATTRCTAAYISRIEAGQRVPTLDCVRRLAAKLAVSPEYLETGVEAVTVTVPVSDIDSDPRKWRACIPWGDLTEEERAQVTRGLQQSLLDTLTARVYVVSINRREALKALEGPCDCDEGLVEGGYICPKCGGEPAAPRVEVLA